MKTILITGGCGFIGSNFIRYALDRTDWTIINLDALTYAGNPANVADRVAAVGDRYRFVHGNICDEALVGRVFGENRVDGVIHFAAESHVDRSILGPRAFIETNVTGTFNLLEQALNRWRESKDEGFRFIHVSTDEVYGSLGETGYFTEKTPYDPSSPYSASKASSDHVARSFFRTYGLPVMVTNCSNNYGPYQFPEKLIPLMMMNILEEKPLPVYGNGLNVRDWLFVLDHCEAILQVFEKGIPGESYNIGGNSEYKNIDIVHLLCDIMDRRLGRSGSRGLIRFVEDRPGHDLRYAIDATKIKSELGWSPAYRFGEALDMTVDWYLSHLNWVKSVQSGEYRSWVDRNYGSRGGV
jgi:dTDP-glucose 4,6-dehydratase